MKHFIFLLLIVLSFHQITANTAVIKANNVRGESMVTVDIYQPTVEKIIEAALKERNINRVENCNEAKYFVDAFIYQFPADYPSVAIIIRNNKGIIYYDNNRLKLFTDRKAAHLKVTEELCKKLPNKITEDKHYSIETNILFNSRQSLSLIQITSNQINESLQENYNNDLDWGENKALPFVFDSFEDYLAIATNFVGIRKKIKKFGPIKVVLSIDESGSSNFVSIDYEKELKFEHKNRIKDLIASFPIWINTELKENIVLTLDLK